MTLSSTPRSKPNIVLFGVDSLRADHMSCYGYPRLTTPYIDRFAQGGTLYENTYSAHIPTTSAYSSMLTGRDVFGTQVVALRHQGPLRCPAWLRQIPRLLRLGQLERGPQPQSPEPEQCRTAGTGSSRRRRCAL